MNWYPEKDLSVELLVKAARRAAVDSSAAHPEDLMIAMTAALEVAAGVIMDAFTATSSVDKPPGSVVE